MKKITNKPLSKPTNAFSRLHHRKSRQVKANPEVSKTLMALSADDHKAIAELISSWMAK